MLAGPGSLWRIKESELFKCVLHESDTSTAAVHQRLLKVSIDSFFFLILEQSFIATTQQPYKS